MKIYFEKNFKETEIGKIPKDWVVKEIGDKITENRKGILQVQQAKLKGKFNFFTSGEKILKSDNFLIEGENLFLATRGKARINYFNGKANYSTDTYSIKSKENKVLEKFNNFVEPFFNKILENSKQNQKLGEMRDYLLPKLMKGEIRIKE